MPGFSRPRRVGVRVERPVRQVQSLDRVGQRLGTEAIRCKPLLVIPGANEVASLRLRDLERKQRLWTERVLDLLVRHQCRRSAELAALADLVRIEDRDRLAALT